jgi:hypothetical protein
MADITITLPTAIGIKGRMYSVFKGCAGTKKVIIDPFGAELINGAANNNTVSSQYKVLTCVSDGANWWILSSQ